MLVCVCRDQGGAAASVRSQVLAGGASQPDLREARALPALLRQTQPAHGVRVRDLLHGAAFDLHIHPPQSVRHCHSSSGVTSPPSGRQL